MQNSMQDNPISDSFSSSSRGSQLRVFLQTHFFLIVAVLTFFLLITAQTLWSTIHGDGAVYAWVTKEMALGWGSGQLPKWDQSNTFAEHPYFFIYFAALFVKFFGDSDIVLKLPNYIVAAFSIFAVYKTAQLNSPPEKSRSIGLIAGYALLLNATYMIQISQPSLDPMAQLLALVSGLVLIFRKNAFLAGLVMGAAFLTKGLELLPNLAALGLTAIYLERASPRQAFKTAVTIAIAVLLPVLAWLALDEILWNGHWLSTYWNRQFVNRFFNPHGSDKAESLGYLFTASRVYFLEFFIFGVWFTATDAWKKKRRDPLFLYFVLYVFFNLLAFLIIKKDSSQHVTGILVTGAFFVGEAIYDLWKRLGAKRLWAVPVSLLVVALAYWSWFIANADYNPDMWTVIKNESQIFRGDARLPIVVRDSTSESYGLYYTAQWYAKSNQVYYQVDADRLLVGREVVYLSSKEDGKLIAARVIYQKGLF